MSNSFSLRRLFKRSESEQNFSFVRHDADRDWKLLCCVFFLLNLFSVGVSVFVYKKVDDGEIFLVDKKPPTSLQTLDRFELEKTVIFFENRRVRFEALRGQSLRTNDPFVPKAKSQE